MVLSLLFLCIVQLEAKYFVKEITYNQVQNTSWLYLTKFAAHIGVTKYDYR